MSNVNDEHIWQGQGKYLPHDLGDFKHFCDNIPLVRRTLRFHTEPAAHDFRYTPSFDYAITAHPHPHTQGGWMPNESAAHLDLHNSQFPPDRPQPSISGPAYYMPDVLQPPTKPFQLPSIKLISYVSCGLPGSRIAVHIKSPLDQSVISTFRFYIMFLDKPADASLKYVTQVEQDHRYALSTNVPEPDAQLSYGTCTLKIAVADFTGTTFDILDVGKFILKRPKDPKRTRTTKKTAKKREASAQVDDLALPPSKKVAAFNQLPCQILQQHPMDTEAHFWPIEQQPQQFQYTLNDGYRPPTNYSLQSMPPTLLHSQPLLGYGPVHHSQTQQHFPASLEPSLDHSVSPKTLYGAPMTPNAFGMDSPMPTSQPPPSRAISPYSENPQLIRTTQLPSQKAFSVQAESPTSGKVQQSNASLRIIGNVNSMLEKWTKEEKMSQRRVVEFESSQAGSVITVTFKQVPLDSRSNTNISVSCIWWEARGEAYITSVDTIRLLEHLVAARFNVQEKNRIRRNLEGYHPLTVAKGRPESDDFFKVVMGYGEPRPRVIEKDIKAFPWNSLNSMLKKVIGKYSADFESTSAAAAGSLLPPSITARSSISGASNNGSWNEQSSLAQAHSPTNSMQLGAGPPPLDCWGTFSASATFPGQQQPLADISFPAGDQGYYDTTASGLYSSSTYMPSIWDSSSAALTATPNSTYSGFPSEFFLDRMHYNYQQPDGLDGKIQI